jgi:uncharacterized protein YlxP (DUF503 family)
MTPFVELIEIRLHFGDVQDLKGKRKLVKSLKDVIRQRFGASVAEVDGHDKWQRSVLLCALVGDGEVSDRAEGLVRLVESRFPDGCSFERDLLSLRDIRD